MNILLIGPREKDKLMKIINSRVVHDCDICKNGLQAISKIRHFNYDLIISEEYLPIIDSISLCTLIKEYSPEILFVIISAEKNYCKKIQAFYAKVDEYIEKPVGPIELGNILEKIIGKVSSRKSCSVRNTGKIKVGDLVADLDRRTVFRFGEEIRLNKKEFNLLTFMMINEGKILNRSTIIEHAWENNLVSISKNVVDVHMNRLRTKIDGEFETKLIRTVHGVGYKLCTSTAEN